jgi:hypothetical protein
MATSSTTCAAMSTLTNCQKTDDDVVCNLCDASYKLVSGLCIANDITDCSIG